jgi:ribosome maturation factor RimP
VEVVMTSPAQSIGELVEPLVTAAGLELWDVEVNPRAVRVLVDRPGGVDLETLAGLARAVSAGLDGRDELAPGARYELEVSSPGVERTLRTPDHYRRFVGTVVNVKTAAPIEGSRRLQGVLLGADDAGITIRLGEEATEVSYDQIQKARTVLIWGPTGGTKTKDAGLTKAARR